MEEHPFSSSLVPDKEAQSLPQSQLVDPGLYSENTIPEFDEQDYTSHRNVFVAVHVPRKTSKHHKHHKSKKRRGHGSHVTHSDPPQTHTPPEDQVDNSNETVDQTGDLPEVKGHKALRSTVSDATPTNVNGLSARPRYHKSHSVGDQRHLDLTLPHVVRDPATPCDPCDRVKFILGGDDTDLTGCPQATVHTIFTELEELKYDENDHGKMEWKETARWVKFEEDVEEGGNKWSKPHVATLSLHSLFELRSCLLKGTVILDMKAENLAQISDYVLDNLVHTGQLEEENRDRVRSALLQRHKHLNSRKESENKILESIRSLGDIGRLNSTKTSEDNGLRAGHLGNNLLGLAGSRGNSRRNSVQVNDNLTDGAGNGGSGSLTVLEEEGTNDSEQDLAHLPKSTNNFMKKIPPGSEASNVLVGEVDFLSHSIIAFVRLSEGRLLGDITEVPIPTRFLFILLGPTGNQERYHEIGRSIATLMSDEVFHEVAYRARNRGDLLAGIDEFLDKVTVLPPGEWDPQIRLEPPSKIPSQEERKQSFDPRKKNIVCKPEEDNRQPVNWRKRPFSGLVNDCLRCYSVYRTDLSGAFSVQFLSSLLLIYFANIAIAFAFGAFLSEKTKGAMGTTETMLAICIGNFLFSIFSGQPLTILATTAPSVVFESIIATFCSSPGIEIPFLEFRFWIGIWTTIFILILVGLNSSAILRLVTRFTVEICSVLLSILFMYQALVSLWNINVRYPYNEWVLRPTLRRACDCYQFPSHASLQALNTSNATVVGSYWDVEERDCGVDRLRTFVGTDCGDEMSLFENHDVFLMSVILFFGMFLVCVYLRKFRTSKFLRTIVRRFVSGFGVVAALIIWVCVDLLADVDTPKVEVPNVFTDRFFTSVNRTSLFVNPLGQELPHWAIGVALLPALLATVVLFVNQHLTSLIVNKKDNKLKKGPGYHGDMFLVALLVFIHSLIGVPWVVGATVLSISHVHSLHLYGSSSSPGEPLKLIGVREQRVTLFAMSILVGCSVMLYSVVTFIPLPVLYGLLFYLGVASLCGVQLLKRFKLLFIPHKYKPDYCYLRRVPNVRIHIYTIIQVLILIVLCALQVYWVLRIILPVIVVALMVLRWLLGFCFSRNDLEVLDDLLPKRLYCKNCTKESSKRGSDTNLEEGQLDEVDAEGDVLNLQPSARDVGVNSNAHRERFNRRSASEFNFTQEVDKCEAWKTVVNDLDVPFSSPTRNPVFNEPRASLSVPNVDILQESEEIQLLTSEHSPNLHSSEIELEETSDGLSEQFGQPKSRACRKLFASTEV